MPTLLSIFHPFAFPFLSNIVVTRSDTQPVGFDSLARSKRTAELFRSAHATSIPELVHGCSVNEDVLLPREQTSEHHVVCEKR